jgi:type I restriction enzyme R subunit
LNHFVVSQQVRYIAVTEVYFDIVLYVNGLPLVVGEVKTATRPSVTWQDGAADFMGGKKHYWKNVESYFVPNLFHYPFMEVFIGFYQASMASFQYYAT